MLVKPLNPDSCIMSVMVLNGQSEAQQSVSDAG